MVVKTGRAVYRRPGAVFPGPIHSNRRSCSTTCARAASKAAGSQPAPSPCVAPPAAQVDEIQYGTDEGPCLDALRTGTVVRVDDLAQEERWDSYRPHAVAHGVVSSLSLPMAVEGEMLGALNLYSAVPAAFVGQPGIHAAAFAERSAAALTVTLRQVHHAQVQHQLADAMVSSSIIDQAIGILMGQQRCTAGAAFDLLRQASQNRNRKLREIATEIIVNVSGGPPQPRPAFRTTPSQPADGRREDRRVTRGLRARQPVAEPPTRPRSTRGDRESAPGVVGTKFSTLM